MGKKKDDNEIEQECVDLCKQYGHKYVSFKRARDKNGHSRIKVVFECGKHGLKETRLFNLRKWLQGMCKRKTVGNKKVF